MHDPRPGSAPFDSTERLGLHPNCPPRTWRIATMRDCVTREHLTGIVGNPRSPWRTGDETPSLHESKALPSLGKERLAADDFLFYPGAPLAACEEVRPKLRASVKKRGR